MGFLSGLFHSRDKPTNSTNGSAYRFLFGGSNSGKAVNERSAMQMTAVYACVRILSESIAGLPVHVYKYTDSGSKEKAIKHPLYRLIHDEPNPEMTSFVFRETLMTHLLLYGNAYAQIIRNGKGEVIALYPLMANRMGVDRDDKGHLYYQYQMQDSDAPTMKNGTVILKSSDVLHIPGLGFDGLVGYSPIAMAKNAIGLAIATEEYGAKFFANGATPGGILEYPGTVKNPEAVRESWTKGFSGNNSHKVAVLEEGMKYTPIFISPNEAQFLETRKFQIDEIARIFRVPPHMVGDLEKRFKLGNITVTDNNDYISYSNSEYSCTLDAIKSKLINTHGGYLMVRYTESEKILDYLAEFNTRSVQSVEYGKNLTDVKITRDHTERITALIPLGAKKKTTDEEGNEVESDERVDITSVNDGLNYIFDETAVKEIGWIWATEVWDDVTLPSNLLRKAKSRLAELIAGITSMELTIMDESDTGADIGSIHARQFVNCLSPPHGIDGRYACMSKTVDYLNPSGNTITIGASGIKLTSISAKQNENLSAIEDELLGQTATIEGISGKVDGIASSKMYRTELIVDGVSIFKDKGQNSRLFCKVYSWDKDITASLPDTAFIWHRKSGNDEADAIWDSNHIGIKSIIVTTEDVQDNASFYCEVSI